MKFAFALSALATVAGVVVSAQSVDVIGAQTQQVAPTMAIRIASRDVLDRATALLNKNALSADNNAFISRSNVVFLQNDRLAMRRRVMEALLRAPDDTDDQQQDAPSLTVAVLAKSVLRAVSAPTTDAALMRRATAVVTAASRGADRQQRDVSATTLVQRIADLVDAVGMREVEQEDAMLMQTPRGVKVLVGTKDALRAPAMMTTTVTVSVASDEPQYRVAIVYSKDRETAVDDAQEQWGRWGAGYGLGWRYPLGYWNAGGAGLYGGGCGLGFARGPFYYC